MKFSLQKTVRIAGEIITYAFISHCFFEHIGDFVLCSGPSMEPTIFSNDILFAEHLTPKFRKIVRGDVIIAKCPSNPKQFICKRIAGLPGDKIRTGFTSSEIVPRGHVWLEGDNRSNSLDSRSYGSIPQGLIRGRAVYKVWPLSDWTSFPKDP